MTNVLNYFEQPSDALNEDNIFNINGTLNINNNIISAVKLGNVLISDDITVYTEAGAIDISGKALIQGDTGFAMTISAPEEGVLTDILIESITSGSVTVTTPLGVTFDGANNTATFDAVDDELILGYKSATEWQIFKNNNVVLSSV